MIATLRENAAPPGAADISPHSRLVALLLCWPFGIFGAHRFYVGRPWSGLFQLLTLGGLQFWTLMDFVLILSGAFVDRDGRPVKRLTADSAELRLFPIVAVAAGIGVVIGVWFSGLLPAANPTFAQIIWPMVAVQALAGLVIGLIFEKHRFLHAVAASVVGSYFVLFAVIVAGVTVLGDAEGDVAQGVGLGAWILSGLFYLLSPVAGLLSLVSGAAADNSGLNTTA